MAAEILISGVTGNVGLEVARCLQANGVPFRAADLRADRVLDKLGPGTDVVPFSFTDPFTFGPAFSGIRKMFLMRPPKITNIKRDMVPAIQAALAAGVNHFVFLSLIGIEQNQRVPHYAIEQALLNLDVETTLLRCSFFMQNLNTTHRAEIRDRNEIMIPAGNARTSFIDARDIGAVAAAALTDPKHRAQVYNLTGGEALGYDSVAQVFSEVLGRRVLYRNPSSARFLWYSVRRGVPLQYALVMAVLYRNTRLGMAEVVTKDVERILGRKPISLRQYIQDYRTSWEAAA